MAIYTKRINKFRFIFSILEDSPGYSYSTNALTRDNSSHKIWSLYKGFKSAYGTQDTDAPGYTMVLHRPDRSTFVTNQLDQDEIAETLLNHEDNFQKFVDQDKALGDYLSSDAGKWGR